ncbi:MAG: leucine-rich repeat protein, partial [Clostridia bacterium]|nr:leucine-rich repeat protein [Clostridia bacterium]
IGDFAFRNCSGLTTLYLPSTVISVGTGILSGLSALTELTVSGAYRLAELMGMDSYVDSYAVTYAENTYYLPLSLKSIIIADGTESIIADAYASSLIESVSLPTGLKIVGERAFAGAIQLTSVIQPTENNTIEEILAYAFSDCTELTAIILYENVTKIGERAFYDCSAMEAVHILSPYCEIGYQAFYNTPWYGHQNGLIYAGNTLLGYSGPVPEGYSLLVEDGTTDIAANAFDSQSGLVAVTLPASIQSIGKAAFKNCLNLTEVEFIGTSQLEEISAQLFYNCQRLESFEIPASIKKIGDSAFYNCRAFDVVVFGNGSLLTELGNEAFMQCAAVAAFLPSSLKTIGAYAFSNCQALENIAMISASALEYIGEYAFYGAKNAVFGVTTFGALSYIGTRAFYSCEKIISVVAPSLEYIGEEAFKNCLAITTLTLTADVRIFDLVGYADNDVSGTMYGVVSYGGEQYSVPVSLTTVHFAQNAVSVKDYALYGAEDILTVSLSAAVVEIGASAFENCALLVTVEGGSALQKIDVGAFRNCSSLSSFDLPASIKTIEDFAFENCTGMTALSLAGNSLLTKIGVGAFQNAGNAVFTFGAITKPLTVGADAFKNCRSLENFVAENVIYYGDGAFDGCDALVSITVTTDGFVGRLFGTEPNAGCYVVNMSATDYYIPLSLTDIFVSQSMSTVADNAFAGLNTIEYVWLNGVSAIGKRAFLGNSALTTITVPASVVIIDDFAFEGCINLESVTLMLADTLTFIGEAAFDDTQWYADIISGVTNDTVYIGKVAYAHIGSISGVLALRSDSIGISPKAFINQTGITELRLPLSMSAIGANAFQNCSSIEALYTTGNFEIGRLFGNQPYGLSYSAVQNGLTYYIPQALKRVFVISGASQLAAQAFAGCYSLTSVSLPVTLYNIGADTMKGCHGLTEMTAPAEFMLGTFFGIDAYENSYSASQNGVNYYFPASLRTVTALGE